MPAASHRFSLASARKPRTLMIQRHHRIEFWIDLIETSKDRLHNLDGRKLSLGVSRSQIGSRSPPKLISRYGRFHGC